MSKAGGLVWSFKLDSTYFKNTYCKTPNNSAFYNYTIVSSKMLSTFLWVMDTMVLCPVGTRNPVSCINADVSS